MRKNSTLKSWNLSLKEEYYYFDRSFYKILSKKQLEPKKETISKILAYARSVRGIKAQSGDNILISLN